MYEQDTIVAPATPPGQGAVAIVRLSGPRAIEILRRLWHPMQTGEIGPRRLTLGEIRDPATGAAIDRALAVMMPGPGSLTGEDVVELQCHGGAFIVRRVVGLAIAEGARIAERGEFSRRAFLNGRMDLTESEAVADLVAARGEAALHQALSQLNGALKERVERLRREVIVIKAHLEVEIDFSDEDIKLPGREQVAADLGRLIADIRILHDSFARGRLMRQGARAAIMGKPNAGKSSILNLLLGIERAIVTPIPGTTRDVIEDSIQLGPMAAGDPGYRRNPRRRRPDRTNRGRAHASSCRRGGPAHRGVRFVAPVRGRGPARPRDVRIAPGRGATQQERPSRGAFAQVLAREGAHDAGAVVFGDARRRG